MKTNEENSVSNYLALTIFVSLSFIGGLVMMAIGLDVLEVMWMIISNLFE